MIKNLDFLPGLALLTSYLSFLKRKERKNRLLTTHYSLLTTYYLLLTTYYYQLTTYYLLLFNYYIILMISDSEVVVVIMVKSEEK